MCFIRYLLLSLFLLSLSSVSVAEEPNTEEWTPRDEDLRILEMRVEQYKLDDVLPTYQRKDYLLVPLGLLSEIVDIAINVDIGTGIADGFIFKAGNTFYLDTTRNDTTIKGIKTAYNKHQVYVLDDDIYVDARLLSKWLGITINADLFASTITLKSDETFPFIARMEREARIAKTRSQLNVDIPYYPYHYEPYDMWNIPFVNQTFEAINQHSELETTTSFRSTTFMTTDLLGMESSLYLLVTDDDILDTYRITLGKKDPESELLGIAQATEYAMGHITEPRVNNITVPGDQQLGALISSFPLNRQNEYDRHRFRGELFPGWEVELYHNDRLIGYQSTPTIEGQYDFQDIPLLFGRNYFRLVFYGPQGQKHEEEQYFELGEALIKKGQHYYRALASENELGGNRAVTQYDMGLSKQISVSFIGASIPLDVGQLNLEQHNYVQAGLRGFWESIFVAAELIDDVNGGQAFNIDMQTSINNTILKFNHTILNDFFSEEYRVTSQQVKGVTEFRIDTAIPPSFLPRIPFSLEINSFDFTSGDRRNEIINQLSLQTYGLSVTNQLTYTQDSVARNLFTGVLGLSSSIKNYSVRGGINYVIQPYNEVSNVDLTLRPPMYRNFQMSYGLNHSLRANLTEVSASATKALGKYTLSFGGRYNTDDVFSLDARFSIGLGREPRQKKWKPSASSIASQGSVSARVFLDNNQDGLFNDGDEALENVGFTINGGYQATQTDKDGIAFVTGIPVHRPVNIAIVESTLEDPLWSIAIDGMRIVPRPGQAMQLDFPIFSSGEIDGTIYVVKDDKSTPAGRVKIEVVNQQGRVVMSSTTEYDGFYVISKIPLGTYTVRISPAQLEKLNLQVDVETSIVISAEELFESGIDFNLTKKVQ